MTQRVSPSPLPRDRDHRPNVRNLYSSALLVQSPRVHRIEFEFSAPRLDCRPPNRLSLLRPRCLVPTSGQTQVLCLMLSQTDDDYVPQHFRIIDKGSSEGFSPWFLLLGSTSAAAAMMNMSALSLSCSAPQNTEKYPKGDYTVGYHQVLQGPCTCVCRGAE